MTGLLAEDALTRLLAEAADAAPAPGRAPEDLLAALSDPGAATAATEDDDGPVAVPIPLRERLSPRFIGIAAAALLVVAILGVTLAGGKGGSTHEVASKADAFAASTTIPVRTTAVPQTGFATGGASGGTTGGTSASASTDLAALGAAGAIAPDSAEERAPTAIPAPAIPAPATPGTGLTDSAKVVKTGSLELQVRKGSFEGAVAAITTKVVGLGGYIADATTSSSSDSPSGTITVRVPSASFDGLVTALQKLGKVQAVTQKGTEVSAQYTDLQARLTAETATRDRLDTVLAKASTVSDILAVQDRITDVQTQIEQLQGQIKLLDDQTSMGTLAVALAEPGAKVPVTPNPDDRTIGSSFSEARHRFGNGIEAVIAWSGSALAVLLVGLIALVVVRLGWSRFRRFLL